MIDKTICLLRKIQTTLPKQSLHISKSFISMLYDQAFIEFLQQSLEYLQYDMTKETIHCEKYCNFT